MRFFRNDNQTASSRFTRIQDKGIPFYFENDTNQQFVILSNAQMEQIGQKHIYEYEGQYDSDHHIVRFCTSWSTRNENVDILVNDIMELNL